MNEAVVAQLGAGWEATARERGGRRGSGPGEEPQGVVATEESRSEVHDVAFDETLGVEPRGDSGPSLHEDLHAVALPEPVEDRSQFAAALDAGVDLGAGPGLAQPDQPGHPAGGRRLSDGARRNGRPARSGAPP